MGSKSHVVTYPINQKSELNVVTPMPVEYSEPNFNDHTPTPHGMVRSMTYNIPVLSSQTDNKIPIFNPDLSKNKLYQKRMERKSRQEWENKNGKCKSVSDS